MFIYRPEYYQIMEDDKGSTAGMADIIIAKHRSGEVGEVRLKFVSKFARFENRDYEGGVTMASGLAPNESFDQAGPGQGMSIVVDSKMNHENEDMF